jgi:hypothetical protein
MSNPEQPERSEQPEQPELKKLKEPSGFNRCTCPEKYKIDGRIDHHPICVCSNRCRFCIRPKRNCEIIGICKGSNHRKNPKQNEVDQIARNDVFNNQKNIIMQYVFNIKEKYKVIPPSPEKDVLIRRAFICGNQYDAIKTLKNPSASDIESADKCLYKLRRVYFDMKSMVKELQTAAKN